MTKMILQQRTSSPPSSCNSNSRETLRPGGNLVSSRFCSSSVWTKRPSSSCSPH